MPHARRSIVWLAAGAVVLSLGANGAVSQQDDGGQRPAETLKERLGSKASDPQRVNDCKVPLGERGDSTRPDDCNHIKRPPQPTDTSAEQ